MNECLQQYFNMTEKWPAKVSSLNCHEKEMKER